MSARARLLPSLPDLLFLAVLLWLFVAGAGWSVLLADGDTGWHIRTGQEILRCRCVPHHDAFAFGTEGRAWYAWEWLSDALFAWLHAAVGLKGVVMFSGLTIAAAAAIVFRHMLWRGTNPFIALAVVLMAASASSVHFLARPHVVTLFLVAAAAWALDRDRLQPWPWIWVLPAVVALWTNLHGGFLAVFPFLAARLIESACVRPYSWIRVRRGVTLASACAIATLLNPYGWRLHRHLFLYLRSDWIRTFVEEFQSPRFRSEAMTQYETLLVLGIAFLPALFARRRLAECGLILVWAHQSLGSVRHVPIYCLIAAPIIASRLDTVWTEWASVRSGRPMIGSLRQIGSDWKRWAPGFSGAPGAVCAALIVLPGWGAWPADFPANKFPVAIVTRNQELLASSAPQPARVFSSDQWSGYLTYRLSPRVLIFMDGRSDFFGSWRGADYARLMEGRPNCAAILEREHVGFALVPATWALAGILAANAHWERMDGDGQAILFRWRTLPLTEPHSE